MTTRYSRKRHNTLTALEDVRRMSLRGMLRVKSPQSWRSFFHRPDMHLKPPGKDAKALAFFCQRYEPEAASLLTATAALK